MNPRFKTEDEFIAWWDEVHETNSNRSSALHSETDLRNNLASSARCPDAVKFKWVALTPVEKLNLKLAARNRGLLAPEE